MFSPYSREMDLALDAIDFSPQDSFRTHYPLVQNRCVNLVNSPSFITNMISFDQAIKRNYEATDSFVILVCVAGSAAVDDGFTREILTTGEVMLIPAIFDYLTLYPDRSCKILEVYLQ